MASRDPKKGTVMQYGRLS